MQKTLIHCDGLAQPNPGRATWAFAIFDNGQTRYEEHGYIGDGVSNNYAEYTAVIRAFQFIHANRMENVDVRTDSMLVVKQVNGLWVCKKPALRLLRDSAMSLLKLCQGTTLGWIPGSTNEADEWTRVAYEEETGRPAGRRFK